MQIRILQGTIYGASIYLETHTPTTNANGLVSVEIGNGTVLNGDFSAIDWSNGPYFIKTETDPAGGTSYTITGTSQLMSVPYALYAKTAETVSGGITETDPLFSVWDKSTGIAIIESQISDLGTYIETETDPSVPTGTQTGEMQYWDGSEWITVQPGSSGQVLTISNGVPGWSNTLGWNDVHNPATGETWMDRNLGATQVATSSIDTDSYGDLYQWGRGTDGHESRISGTTYTLSSTDTPRHGVFIFNESSPYDWRNPQNDNLWQGVSGTNNPCPNGYRLPTYAEWEAEITSWSSNGTAGAFASPLKLPMAGNRRSSSGLLDSVGSLGYYWSSSLDGSYSRSMAFYSSHASIYRSNRAYGFSVRCIKD